MKCRRLIAMLLSLVMTIAYLPAMAFADSDASGDAEVIIAEDTQELPVDEPDMAETAVQSPKMNLNEAQTGDEIASGTCGTCDWVIDAKGNLIVSAGELENWGWYGPPWEEYSEKIIRFKTTGTVKAATCKDMFSCCTYMVSVDLSNLDTSEVEDMSGMFLGCYALEEIDLRCINTTNVTDMSHMFDACRLLSSLDVSGFNTSKVTNMNFLFYGCEELTSLDVSHFDTSNVTDMGGMFDNCMSLTQLDLSSFNTAKVISMDSMFYHCVSLDNLDISHFDTSNVTDMGCMFNYCNALTQLDVSMFDTGNVTDMYGMFHDCNALKALDLSNFNTSKVTEMGNMFNGCTSLEVLDVSNFDTSGITEMGSNYSVMDPEGMFSGCSSLVSLDLSSFDTSNVTNMGAMFCDCESLQAINLSSFDTSKVTDMSGMFCNCRALRNLDLSNFDTSNVTVMRKMFMDCRSLSSVDLSSFNTSKVGNMMSMFMDCGSLSSVDLRGFNTSKVENMLGMFFGCNSLISLDLSSFDTSNADDLGEMFYNCTSLRSLKTGTWVYSEQVKADGYYPAFPVNMKDSTSGKVYNANTSIPELSNRTYVYTDESIVQYRHEVDHFITEDELYTTQYRKYLFNSSHEKITKTLLADMQAINAERSAIDNAGAVLISNMKQGAISSVIKSVICGVTGKYYNLKEIEETVALGYIQTISNDKNLAQGIVDSVSKEFKWSKKSYDIIKSGFKNESERKELAKVLSGGIYSEAEALEIIRDTEDNWEAIDKKFSTAGKVLNAAEVATTIIVAAQSDSEATIKLMRMVDKDTALYAGLKSLRGKQKWPAENIVAKLLADGFFDKVVDFMTDQGIGRLASLFAETGGIQVGMATAVAGIGYYVLGSIVDCFSASSDEVVTSIISVSNQCALYGALVEMRTEMSNSNDPASLKEDYKFIYSAYMAALDQGVNDVLKAAKSGKSKDRLVKDYSKYKSQLNYEQYIDACIANANAPIDYYVSNGKACITRYNKPASKKSVAMKSVNSTTDSSLTKSDDALIYIDVPDTVDGYPVEIIGESAFIDDTSFAGVFVPQGITAIESTAFKGCSNLTDLFLEAGITSIGDRAFSNCSSIESVTLPDTIENLGESIFEGVESVTLCAKNTDIIDKYIEGSAAGNVTSEKIAPELTEIRIATPAGKQSYKMSEISELEAAESGTANTVDLEGLTLTAVYDDGSEEVVEDGILGYFEEKKLGESTIIVCYDTCRTSYTVSVASDDCSYEIAYVNEVGVEIAQRTQGIAATGTDVSVAGGDIEGYRLVSEPRKETIGSDNYFEVQYETIHKPNVGDAVITFSAESYAYTGEEIRPAVTVTYQNKVLSLDQDYTMRYDNNINIGEAAVVIEGIGEYGGIAIEVFTIKAQKNDISTLDFADLGEYVYRGFSFKPCDYRVKLKSNDPAYLQINYDYTVEYRDNINAGTATAVLTGCGDYTGTKELNFTILPFDVTGYESYFRISAATYTYDGKVKNPALKYLIDKDEDMLIPSEPASADYTIKSSTDRKSVGRHTVQYAFKNNFTGKLSYGITINPKGTTLSKLKKGKKSFTVTWKKQAVQTTGYQIQYGLKSNFKGAKTVTIKKNKTVKGTVKKLKAKKKYYVRIRTYRTVGGKTYYSAWSKAKSVKTK